MDRRRFVAMIGSALVAPLARAQQPAKTARIGFLGTTSASSTAARVEALQAGLRELGYVEGKNLVIEFRWADGNYDRLPALAAELARLKVDVIVTHGAPGALAAKRATTTIPIVIASTGDAITSGLVASLARPGGNMTGLSFFSPELNAKRLELLRELFPRIQRVAVLINAGNASNAWVLEAMDITAKALKVELQRFAVRSPSDFESALAAMAKPRVEALVIREDPLFIAHAGALAALASKQRMPSIGFIELAEAGGLMAYGVSFPAMFRRSAVFVDKILKGANPGELPIERATKFDLAVNMKTAKTLGLKIPQSLLLRADRVIE